MKPETEVMLAQAQDEVDSLKAQGWTTADFAQALSDMLNENYTALFGSNMQWKKDQSGVVWGIPEPGEGGTVIMAAPGFIKLAGQQAYDDLPFFDNRRQNIVKVD